MSAARDLLDADDGRLVARLQAGEAAAFDVLYERHWRAVHAYLSLTLGDPHDAEEVAQEVFVSMLAALPRFQVRGSPFRVWLFRVARNRCLDRLKKRRRASVEPPAVVEELAIGSTDGAEDPVWRRLSDAAFVRLIQDLPRTQRQVIALRFLLGMSVAHTADVLDSTPNAVRNVQFRAFGSLRTKLGARRALTDSPPRAPSRLPCGGSPFARRFREAPVLRGRRFMLAR